MDKASPTVQPMNNEINFAPAISPVAPNQHYLSCTAYSVREHEPGLRVETLIAMLNLKNKLRSPLG